MTKKLFAPPTPRPPPHFYRLLSPPPPSQFYCFPPPLPPHFYCFSPPPPPHSYCFLPPPPHFYCFPPRHSIKDFKTTIISLFCIAIPRVVKNNRGFLQLLSVCSSHQRQFLPRTATPQQLHAIVQILNKILKEYIPIPEENKRKLLSYEEIWNSLP